MELTKEGNFQYYKVHAGSIPQRWSNKPEDLKYAFSAEDLRKGFSEIFKSTSAFPVLSLPGAGFFLLRDEKGAHYIWGAISGTLDRVEDGKTTEEILPRLNDIAQGLGLF